MSWLSSLLGMDAQHNAGIAMNQAKQQAGEAQNWRQQASGGFSNLANMGQFDRNQFERGLPAAMSAFQTSSGLNLPGQMTPQENPYQLTPAQQDQLNGHIDELARAQDAAVQNYRADMARRGLTDPGAIAAGEQQIRQGYAGLETTHRANFAEAARANRQSAAETMMNYLRQMGAQGSATYGQATTGTADLGAQAQGASGQSYGQAQSQQAMANAAQQQVLQLAAFAAGGGFGGKSAQAAPGGSGGAPHTVSGYGTGGLGGYGGFGSGGPDAWGGYGFGGMMPSAATGVYSG